MFQYSGETGVVVELELPMSDELIKMYIKGSGEIARPTSSDVGLTFVVSPFQEDEHSCCSYDQSSTGSRNLVAWIEMNEQSSDPCLGSSSIAL